MKIVHKVLLANTFHIVLILIIAFFAYRNISLLLAKLRFVEMADDFNSSLLEMRLAEKNCFLYGDCAPLLQSEHKLGENMGAIAAVNKDITHAIGDTRLEQLKVYVASYQSAVGRAQEAAAGNQEVQARIREAGQKLRQLSGDITHFERKKVNEIITDSQRNLLYSLCMVIVSICGISYIIVYKILLSLKKIEKLTGAISEGDFEPVNSHIPPDECGSVIRAINSMSQELKNREEQIIQSRKLASIGILTAGVAHELGNPLNNISMISQNFQELYRLLSDHDRIDYMRKVEEETERIRDIIKNLLDFSKPKKPNLKPTDINSVVHKSLKLVQNMLHINNIETTLNLPEGLPQVHIDSHQIRGVLINLLTNAIQAMPLGNMLFLTTRLGSDGQFVEVEVKDTGRGIPPNLLPHIFDPFFTTKGVSGTGLGLFVSYGIVKNHKGRISASSEPGQGATFVVQLPVCRSEGVCDA